MILENLLEPIDREISANDREMTANDREIAGNDREITHPFFCQKTPPEKKGVI